MFELPNTIGGIDNESSGTNEWNDQLLGVYHIWADFKEEIFY